MARALDGGMSIQKREKMAEIVALWGWMDGCWCPGACGWVPPDITVASASRVDFVLIYPFNTSVCI